MGLYRTQVLPRLIDVACGSSEVSAWRKRCLEGLSGEVVEPGFGSGLNLAHYPASVTRVHAIDPAVVGRKLAADRVRASAIDVTFLGLDGQQLPLADNSCDAGVLTFTLCTIPDPAQALAELRRVIRPGGKLHFLEHGQAPTERIQRWQRRIDPVQRRLFDGCHVSRDHPALIQTAGFEIDHLEQSYASGPKPWSFFHLGKATNRSGGPSPNLIADAN